MNVAIEAAIIGGFVGAVVGGGIAYYLSRRAIKASFELIRLQDFNKAATEFRNAFIIQLNFLKYNVNSGSGDTSNIGEYLKAHYVKSHLVAFEVFRNYLSIKERKAIDKAWIEYCNFNQYSNNKDLALKNLEDVLEFAKHK